MWTRLTARAASSHPCRTDSSEKISKRQYRPSRLYVCSSGKSCDAGSARHGAQLQACRAFLACKALSSIWSERGSVMPNMCTTNKGFRRRRTRFLRDQLGRADAGSWQIADPGDLWTARAQVTVPSAICEFTSSSSCSWSLNRAVLDEGANMVSRTKERALDPLLVPALPALATPSICWLRGAAASDTLAQHPCSSTAVCATAGSSARASELSSFACRLRPASQPLSRRVGWPNRCELVYGFRLYLSMG